MLSRWRQRIGNRGDRIIPAAVGLLLFGAIIWGLSRTSGNTQPEIVQLTIDEAIVQINAGVPTLAANLTQTPPIAALTGAAPTLSLGGQQEIRQFAASARADSQISDLDWGAIQAAGPPNTPECGDFRTAWATAQPNTTGVLILYFPQLVRPTALLVYQTYNPGFITQIALTDVVGEVHILYQAIPQLAETCPATLYVPINGLQEGYAGNAVTITIDQTGAPGRTQIDAAELIGVKY